MPQLLMTVTPEERAAIKQEAANRGLSVSNVLREAMKLEAMQAYRFTPETARAAGIRSAEENSKARG